MTEPAANEALRVLEERARRLAAPPASAQMHDLVELTRFVVNGDRYALENRFVRAIVPLGSVTPLPGCPEWVTGLTSIRGEVVLVVDLHRFFEVSGSGQGMGSHLVVCGEDQTEFAIVVESVEGVASLPAAEIQTVPATLPRSMPEFVRGIVEGTTTVLAGAELLADGRIHIDQSQTKEL